MATQTDKVIIEDKRGFQYEVEVSHYPHHGFSSAKYRHAIIATRDYGKMHEPMSDNDHEWEMYEERLDEWAADAITDLTPMCQEHFNLKN